MVKVLPPTRLGVPTATLQFSQADCQTERQEYTKDRTKQFLVTFPSIKLLQKEAFCELVNKQNGLDQNEYLKSKKSNKFSIHLKLMVTCSYYLLLNATEYFLCIVWRERIRQQTCPDVSWNFHWMSEYSQILMNARESARATRQLNVFRSEGSQFSLKSLWHLYVSLYMFSNISVRQINIPAFSFGNTKRHTHHTKICQGHWSWFN